MSEINNPICVICDKPIEISNPLEMQEGFVHRACWMKKTLKKVGVQQN